MDSRNCPECNEAISNNIDKCPHCGARTLPEESTDIDNDEKGKIKKWLEETKEEYDEFGGWKGFAGGDWFWSLIQKSFKNYWARANAEYFSKKYPELNTDQKAKKLISVAARNSAILGAITAAAISIDEIGGLLALGGMGVSLPANLAFAAGVIGAEALLLTRFQLQLVANLGKLYSVPLNPDDPEDVLTIIAFALGGAVAEAAGKVGMKPGGALVGQFAKAYFAKERLALLKKIGKKVGIKVLQRSIIKYTIPVASIGLGVGWNYTATKAVGKVAIMRFRRK